MSDSDDDVPFEKKGNLYVILGTNVVIHPRDCKILGITVQEEGEWILVVPVEATRAMCEASEKYYYDLPETAEDQEEEWEAKKESIREELETAKDEIQAIHRRIEDLMDVYHRLEKLQEELKD